MLHNPNWNKTARDISLDDFIGWLETKDPSLEYDFWDNTGNCLIGQYMADRKLKWFNGYYHPTCTRLFGSPYTTQEILQGRVSDFSISTFGAALKIVKAFKKAQEA
jgi:hypothetical protein